MFFIPTIDEFTGDLTYTFDLFESIDNIETLVIVMPEEFSISLEDEEEDIHPSIVVKLTFYDLIQTWSRLLLADKIIIYHDNEIDRAGIELEGFRNKFWGIKNDPLLDFIHIGRKYFLWLQHQIKNVEISNKEMFYYFSKFYQKECLADFDEKDPLQKIIYDSLIKQMRKIFEKRKKYTRKLTQKMFEILDQHYKNQAIIEWDKLTKQGKLLYYIPKQKPIF